MGWGIFLFIYLNLVFCALKDPKVGKESCNLTLNVTKRLWRISSELRLKLILNYINNLNCQRKKNTDMDVWTYIS